MQPDHTAVRVALWRALHVELDAPPHVLEDQLGLALAAPLLDEGWRARGDMHPIGTRTFRTSIVARARFIEDLVEAEAARGVDQYVLLGAGLDTFAQRRAELASTLRVFEVDQPGTQVWKRDRLRALGYDEPAWLHFVPVDFEQQSWWDELVRAGFEPARPAVIASTGVSMYLTREANAATLREIASHGAGKTFAMSFLRSIERLDPAERPGLEMAMRGAAAAGTPFVSFYAPEEIVALAKEAGFRDARHVSAADLTARYFADRTDGLRPSNGEELLVATT